MYQVSLATFINVAIPYCAMVLEPVEPEPAKISVTPTVGVTVTELLAIIKIEVPIGNATLLFSGMVTVPVP